ESAQLRDGPRFIPDPRERNGPVSAGQAESGIFGEHRRQLTRGASRLRPRVRDGVLETVDESDAVFRVAKEWGGTGRASSEVAEAPQLLPALGVHGRPGRRRRRREGGP